MKSIIILQAVFIFGGLAVLILARRMGRLNRELKLPGVGWWAAGYSAIALSAIGSAADFYIGYWIKGFLTHLLLTGGVAVVWVGSRLFLEGRVGPVNRVVITILLLVEAVGIYWFYYVEPAYQARLTVTCVVLFILSLGLSLTLFLSRMDDRAVIASGVCYSLFALLNGLRTLGILVNPVHFAYYLSGPLALVATMLMVPVLIAAQLAGLRMIRGSAQGLGPDAD